MLDAAEDGAERAYALGCFLHGITDNNVHHVVNYFSGETFTLYPKEAADSGDLAFSLLNVVRHMTVESKIEGSLVEARPDAFSNVNMRHKIASDLYRRVYLDPGNDRGLWHWFAGELVARKNDALRAAHLEGFDPNDHLELTIEEIKEQGLTIDLDRRVMDAYIDFLKTGGVANDGLSPGGIEPGEYVLLLPEIIEDVKRLLDIAEAKGIERMDAVVDEWRAEGECSLTCPILRTKKELYEHLFQDGTDGTRSLFGQAVDLKKAQLDDVINGYILSVERLSNLVVTKGFAGMGVGDLEFAMTPLTQALDQVTDFPYEILFPDWAVDVIQNVAPLREFLEGTFQLVKDEFKAQILARVNSYLGRLREELLALTPQVVQDLHAKAQELRDIAHAQIDEARLAALGIDLRDADAAFAHFDKSVLYANSFNSIAGALANQEVVFSQAQTSFFGGGPVSFDASYQVGYTQLSVCGDYRRSFYPCGTSAIEVLQPNYESCETLEVTPEMEPNVECHDGSDLEFTDNANPLTCSKRHLDEIVSNDEGHLGSYTLAFPPELADRGPECFAPDIPGLRTDDAPADDVGGGAMSDVGDDEGCACTAGRAGGSGGAALLWLGMLGLVRRRR
jgi:MYXO-CTERM domain-containing protein